MFSSLLPSQSIERQALAIPPPPPRAPQSFETKLSNVAKSRPPLEESTPGTFSQIIHSGSISAQARRYSSMSWPRRSLSPFRAPATENAWQGLPPTTMLAVPRYLLQSTLVTSPRLGMCGKFFARTFEGVLSNSQNAIGSQPNGFHATLAASIPLKRLMYFIFPFRSLV